MIALGLKIAWKYPSSWNWNQIEPIVAQVNCLATKVQLEVKENWVKKNILNLISHTAASANVVPTAKQGDLTWPQQHAMSSDMGALKRSEIFAW